MLLRCRANYWLPFFSKKTPCPKEKVMISWKRSSPSLWQISEGWLSLFCLAQRHFLIIPTQNVVFIFGESSDRVRHTLSLEWYCKAERVWGKHPRNDFQRGQNLGSRPWSRQNKHNYWSKLHWVNMFTQKGVGEDSQDSIYKGEAFVTESGGHILSIDSNKFRQKGRSAEVEQFWVHFCKHNILFILNVLERLFVLFESFRILRQKVGMVVCYETTWVLFGVLLVSLGLGEQYLDQCDDFSQISRRFLVFSGQETS